MQELIEKKIKIIHRGGRQTVTGPVAPKKGLTLFGLFTSSKPEIHRNNTATALKGPVLKSSHLDIPRVNLTAIKSWVALEEKIVQDYKNQKTAQFKSAPPLPKIPAKQPPVSHVPRADPTTVRSWVALEEKIVHDYKEQKTPQFRNAVPLPKVPTKQPLPAFETFTTQTAVPLSSRAPKIKGLPQGSQKSFLKVGRFLLVVGGVAAGVLVFLHVQETFLNREVSQRLARFQSEKEQLGQSYAELKNASENQSAEMKWLNNQLRDMASELKTAKANKIAYEQGLGKKYREELMRITIRYESELAALRGTVQTQNAIVNALRAQSQAFGKIIDQVGMSALSGAAAGFSQEPFSTGGTSAIQGEIASVNEPQGFVVINRGATQGIRSGREITISRSGIGLAVGRIDRVYPTMSAAVLRNSGMLQVIQEGDSVSFS